MRVGDPRLIGILVPVRGFPVAENSAYLPDRSDVLNKVSRQSRFSASLSEFYDD